MRIAFLNYIWEKSKKKKNHFIDIILFVTTPHITSEVKILHYALCNTYFQILKISEHGKHTRNLCPKAGYIQVAKESRHAHDLILSENLIAFILLIAVLFVFLVVTKERSIFIRLVSFLKKTEKKIREKKTCQFELKLTF